MVKEVMVMVDVQCIGCLCSIASGDELSLIFQCGRV